MHVQGSFTLCFTKTRKLHSSFQWRIFTNCLPLKETYIETDLEMSLLVPGMRLRRKSGLKRLKIVYERTVYVPQKKDNGDFIFSCIRWYSTRMSLAVLPKRSLHHPIVEMPSCGPVAIALSRGYDQVHPTEAASVLVCLLLIFLPHKTFYFHLCLLMAKWSGGINSESVTDHPHRRCYTNLHKVK